MIAKKTPPTNNDKLTQKTLNSLEQICVGAAALVGGAAGGFVGNTVAPGIGGSVGAVVGGAVGIAIGQDWCDGINGKDEHLEVFRF